MGALKKIGSERTVSSLVFTVLALTGLLSLAPLPPLLSTAFAATFVVDSTGDGGDSNAGNGTCDDGGGNCTLRAAIEEANAWAGADVINFTVAGGGPHTIAPGSALPTITDQVTIDGYTQTGASANTQAVGSDAVLKD